MATKPFEKEQLVRELSKVDFYRSVPADLTSKSRSGGVISIITILIVMLLLITETREFYAERRYSTIMVERVSGADNVAVDINMTVYDYHCKDIIIYYRLRTSGKVLGKIDMTHIFLTDLDDHLTGCMIEGGTTIAKAAGFVEVTLRKAGSKNITLHHYIDHIILGDNVQHGDEVMWDDHIPEMVFNPLRDHKSDDGLPGEDVEYHLQLVHTTMQYEQGGQFYDPYQYTYSVKHHKTRDHYPGLKFFFEWSPITIHYGVKEYHHADLMGKWISVVGGIFTLSLFLHSFLVNSANSILDKSFASSTKLGA